MRTTLIATSGLFAVLVACATQPVEPTPVVSFSDAAATVPLVTSDDAAQARAVSTPDFSDLDSDTELTPSLALPVTDDADVAASAEPVEVGRYFRLRRGETLAHFARWAELPVEEIAQVNDLDLDGVYPVGMEVFLPLSGQALADVERRREAHRTARVDGYLASRGGTLGTDFYAVRTGDTAWDIARVGNGIPVWMLEAYNPSVDLDHLRPGQELMMPVLADVVVDAADLDAQDVDAQE